MCRMNQDHKPVVIDKDHPEHIDDVTAHLRVDTTPIAVVVATTPTNLSFLADSSDIKMTGAVVGATLVGLGVAANATTIAANASTLVNAARYETAIEDLCSEHEELRIELEELRTDIDVKLHALEVNITSQIVNLRDELLGVLANNRNGNLNDLPYRSWIRRNGYRRDGN